MDLRRVFLHTVVLSGVLGWAFAGAAGVAANKPKNQYNITINYELGMHCTGFDFSYCCVLPPYNSIQSQVIKTATGPREKPQLLGSDPQDSAVLVDLRGALLA